MRLELQKNPRNSSEYTCPGRAPAGVAGDAALTVVAGELLYGPGIPC